VVFSLDPPPLKRGFLHILPPPPRKKRVLSIIPPPLKEASFI